MAYHVRVLAGHVDRLAGSHVYHLELARRLAVRGHHVSLVCFSALMESGCGVEVHRLPLPQPTNVPWMWRCAALRNAHYCQRNLSRLKMAAADVVVGGEHLFLKPHARKFPHTPWLYLPHSLLVDQEIRSYHLPRLMQCVTQSLYVRLQKWALTHSTRTLRFTEMACQALRKRYHGIQPRFIVNPMGADLPSAAPRLPVGRPVRLLWVGQLIPRKRIDLVLSALAQATDSDWTFDIVGDGAAKPELMNQARQLALGKRVRFHGFHMDPSPWYRQADLLTFPSWLENFPVTMIEAMSFGVPCLAMRGNGVRYHTANAEIIDHGRDGFLANSDEDFSTQLRDLLRRPHAIRTAGDFARETIAKRYTWERHLERLETQFAQLIDA